MGVLSVVAFRGLSEEAIAECMRCLRTMRLLKPVRRAMTSLLG